MKQAKVCGLSTHPTVAAAVANGARHLGFVFFPPSPRAVGFEQASDLCRAIPGHVGRVGVFVDPDDELVERAIAAAGLTALQIHKAAPTRVAHLRRTTGLKTWAAIAVKTRADVAQAAAYDGAASAILFDAKTPDDATLPGGMGIRFDWSLLDGYRHTMPWGLSGGLDAGNVAEAIRRTGAPLVDASSGLETAPGIKDVDKITAFLQSVAAS